MEQFIEFGFAGVMAGVALKALDLAGGLVKARLNGHKPPEEGGNAAVMAKLEVIQRTVGRLERKVIDGNGGEPLVVQVTRIQQKLEDHVGDKGLHTSEK